MGFVVVPREWPQMQVKNGDVLSEVLVTVGIEDRVASIGDG